MPLPPCILRCTRRYCGSHTYMHHSVVLAFGRIARWLAIVWIELWQEAQPGGCVVVGSLFLRRFCSVLRPTYCSQITRSSLYLRKLSRELNAIAQRQTSTKADKIPHRALNLRKVYMAALCTSATVLYPGEAMAGLLSSEQHYYAVTSVCEQVLGDRRPLSFVACCLILRIETSCGVEMGAAKCIANVICGLLVSFRAHMQAGEYCLRANVNTFKLAASWGLPATTAFSEAARC